MYSLNTQVELRYLLMRKELIVFQINSSMVLMTLQTHGTGQHISQDWSTTSSSHHLIFNIAKRHFG